MTVMSAGIQRTVAHRRKFSQEKGKVEVESYRSIYLTSIISKKHEYTVEFILS